MSEQDILKQLTEMNRSLEEMKKYFHSLERGFEEWLKTYRNNQQSENRTIEKMADDIKEIRSLLSKKH